MSFEVILGGQRVAAPGRSKAGGRGRGDKSVPRAPPEGTRASLKGAIAPQEAPRPAQEYLKRVQSAPRGPKSRALVNKLTIDHPSKIWKKKYIDKTCCPSTLGAILERKVH